MLLWDSYSQGMYASFAPAAMEYTRSWRTGVLVGRIRVWFSPTRAATKHVTGSGWCSQRFVDIETCA